MRKCLILSGLFFLLLVGIPLQAQQSNQPQDTFYYLTQLNKAQLVMLEEEGLVSTELAGRIAQGMEQVIARESRPGAQRSGDYLVFEDHLMDIVGSEASNLHMGRSRNDLGTSFVRMFMREEALATLDAMLSARRKLLDLAAAHVDTVIPAYTHAVQAQPTSLAHYLLALDSALNRDSQRLRETYQRINRSPLGAGAFTTSGFPLDRFRVAELVGFEGLVENTYDAIAVSVADSKIELAGTLATSAIALGRFAQSLVIEYGDPMPWIYLGEEVTGRSSIMPQKRNPGLIESLRRVSSRVIAQAHTVVLSAHNTPFTEVGDVRYALKDRVLETTDTARTMYGLFGEVLQGLVVIPERALAKVNADYSTMTELADTLLREAGVPFRVGHHVASELASYGREHDKRPVDLTYEEVARIYERVTGEKIPLNESQVRNAFDPRHMVANRKGHGGPQPEEVKRMLAEHRQQISGHSEWIQSQRSKLETAQQTLDRAFGQLTRRD